MVMVNKRCLCSFDTHQSSLEQVLATYRNQLREYRALQEELTPWTHAFQERHGRKPRLIDVEHTGALLHELV